MRGSVRGWTQPPGTGARPPAALASASASRILARGTRSGRDAATSRGRCHRAGARSQDGGTQRSLGGGPHRWGPPSAHRPGEGPDHGPRVHDDPTVMSDQEPNQFGLGWYRVVVFGFE